VFVIIPVLQLVMGICHLTEELLQASFAWNNFNVQKTSLLEDSQAWNSQNKFKWIPTSQNSRASHLTSKGNVT